MALSALIPAGISLLGGLFGKKTPKTINGMPAQSGRPGVGGGGGTDWLGLATTAAGFLSGADDSRQEANRLAEQRRQFDAQMGQGQANQALSATQMDPLAQQRSRQRMALVEQLLKGASMPTLEGNRFTGGFQYGPEQFAQIASFFAPGARAAAEGQFAGAANTASGGRYGQPDLAALGYGQPGPGAVAPTPTTPMPGTARLADRFARRRFDDQGRA